MANIIEITDFSAPELDVFARLTEAQLRNRSAPKAPRSSTGHWTPEMPPCPF